jgi:DNA-binding PadR family transcriptional regulator
VYIPSEAYSAKITDFQFRLFAILCRSAAPGGLVETTVAQLCIETGKASDKTIRSALQGLEASGLIETSQTKRANGYLGRKKITVKNYQQEGQELVENYRTSHDYVTNSHPSYIATRPLVPNSHSSKASYKLKESETEGFTKEIRVPMRRWEDDGDSLAGFGLVEPKDAPQPKIRKSDPKTRGKRPEHEWTAMDVAAEFSYQVGRKYPLLPGTVSVKSLSGAMRKFRSQYGTTPLIELELLRLFMQDERNFKDIGDEAPHLYKKYLASFGTKMNQARENLGLNKVTAKVETTPASGTLISSDGRVFQNSLSGRAQLERHEKRLKGKEN